MIFFYIPNIVFLSILVINQLVKREKKSRTFCASNDFLFIIENYRKL